MSIIIPANSAVGGGFDVDNSLRFNKGSTDYLNKTLGTPTLATKSTISLWFKKVRLGSPSQGLIFANGNAGGINLDTTALLQLYNAGGALKPNRVFRDLSAWYHVVVATDTTLNTADDRLKMYINGVQETSFQARTNPSQNAASSLGTATAHVIGCNNDPANYFSGYMSECVFIDGTALDPTSFGEFDEDSGIWKPIDVSGLTFGTNGFYLDFENSGALGADVSGNTNNFTVNNLTAVDQSTDTCTNNGAVLNNLYSSSGTGFSEGNLNYTYSSSAWRSALSTIASNQGKWYMEIKKVSGTYAWFGVCGENLAETVSGSWMGNANGGSGTNIGWGAQSGNVESNGTNLGYFGGAMADGTIVGIALDLDNDYIYYSKDGSFINSGDPTSGSSGTGGFALPNKVALENYFFGFSSYAGSVLSTNFGSPSFAISSGNTDGNGYGNFEYAVPSGYYSLNTKNLSEYG